MEEKKRDTSKNVRSSEELNEILERLAKQGFVKREAEYFEVLKQEILKRDQKEITRLKKELNELAAKKFTNKDEFLAFVEKLLPNLPPPAVS